MSIDLITLIPIFFIIAVLYSSAGFGGGSSYLAVLSLSSLPFEEFRMIALLCNIAVVTGSVWIFHKSGLIQLKRILPLVLLSIPFAFIGGRLKLSEDLFFILLAVTLLVAGIMMLWLKDAPAKKLPTRANGIIGGAIGLLSGMVGIGGGIFLSPTLNLSRWADAKVIAATTALFILVNSIAGLTGQIVSNGFNLDIKMVSVLIASVILGGQIGARVSANKFHPSTIKSIAGSLIIIVAIRLLWQHAPSLL